MKTTVFKWTFRLLLASAMIIAPSCSKDDADEPDYTEQEGSGGSNGNSGGSSTGVALERRGYYEWHSVEEVLHDKQYYTESYTTQIQFTSATSCRIRNYGTTYKYSNGRYQESRIDKTSTCSYSLSGRSLTIKKMPQWWFGSINSSYDMTFNIVGTTRLVDELDHNYDWCNVSTKL